MSLLAGSLVIIALALMAVRPAWGILAIFVARPIVDAAYLQQVLPGIRLTELFSGAVPLLVLMHMMLPGKRSTSLSTMPLRTPWLLWAGYIAVFSALIMYQSSLLEGFNVLFRHLNGFIAFYMVQAYLVDDRSTKRLLIALAVAGLFPMSTGIYEAVTGVHWSVTYGEGGLIRNIGMYHDAITIRYLAFQTILALALLSACYLQRSFFANSVLLGYGLACVAVLVGAYSKSGLLTFAIWLLLWPLLLRKAGTLTLVAFGAMGVALFYSAEIVDIVSRVFTKELAVVQGTAGVERTFSGRWYVWDQMLKEWEGFSAIQQVFGSGKVGLGAHNDYLNVLFHGGFVGLLLYIGLLVAIGLRSVRNVFERRDPWNVAACLVLVMWLVDTIGLVPSGYSGYQWFAWGTVGLALKRHAIWRAETNRGRRASVSSTRVANASPHAGLVNH